VILDVAKFISNFSWDIVIQHIILYPVVVANPVLDLISEVINCENVLEALHAYVGVGVIVEEKLVEHERVSAVVLPF